MLVKAEIINGERENRPVRRLKDLFAAGI